MAFRVIAATVGFPVTTAVYCRMLGCDIDGANVAGEPGFSVGIDASKAGVKWVASIEDGPSLRLQCTSDDVSGGELVTCTVYRNAPNATGLPGLVAVRDNGTVAWTDYTVSQTTGHPVRGVLSPGDTEALSKDYFFEVNAADVLAGLPYHLDGRGSFFSPVPVANKALLAVVDRGSSEIFTIETDGLPGGEINLHDGESEYRAIGTPVARDNRFYVIAQRSNASEEDPACALFALDAHLALSDRVQQVWTHRFLCPPGELREYTDLDAEVPLVTRGDGLLFFPGRSPEGRLQLVCVHDNQTSASEVFSVDIELPGAAAQSLAVRTISAVPSGEAAPEDLLLSFESTLNATARVGIPLLARVSSGDGQLRSQYDLSASASDAFVPTLGSRFMVLPSGMVRPEARANETDVAFLASGASNTGEIWLVVARLGTALEMPLAVKLTTVDPTDVRPGLQIVPLDAALVATVGSSLYAVGDIGSTATVV